LERVVPTLVLPKRLDMRSRKLDPYQEPLGPFSWVWIFNWLVLRAVPVATLFAFVAVGYTAYSGN
jgi:hypothetical protein